MAAPAIRVKPRKKWVMPYETAQCAALIEWANLQLIVLPELQFLFHIPNEGRRTKFERSIIKSIGLKKGVWDYFLPVPRQFEGNPVPGLWIEMKKPGEELTKEQAWWGREMEKQGYLTMIAYSWVTAKEVLCRYLASEAVPMGRRH